MKKQVTNQTILRLLQPHVVIASGILISALAWVFPDFGYLRKGLVGGKYPVSVSGIFLVLLWIICLVGSTYISYTVTVRVVRPWQRANRRVPIDAYMPYLLVSLIGWTGAAYVAIDLVRELGVLGVLEAVKSNNANALKLALYEDYRIGLPSLRYVTILAGALALYHFAHRRFIFLNILNLLALGSVSLVSSRLAVICAVITALPLIASTPAFTIRKRTLVLGAAVLFLVLSALNWSRNGNFYRNYGIDNWLLAGFSEIIAYVGSPFQGFLAAATLRDVLVGQNLLSLPHYIQVSPELTTNSAFLQLITEGGTLWAFSFGTLICMLSAAACGFAYVNRRNFFFLIYGPLLYSFAELWRIYLFGQGIIKTLIVVAVVVPLVLILVPAVRIRMRVVSSPDHY